MKRQLRRRLSRLLWLRSRRGDVVRDRRVPALPAHTDGLREWTKLQLQHLFGSNTVKSAMWLGGTSVYRMYTQAIVMTRSWHSVELEYELSLPMPGLHEMHCHECMSCHPNIASQAYSEIPRTRRGSRLR